MSERRIDRSVWDFSERFTGDGKFPETFHWDLGAAAGAESSAALHGLAVLAAARRAEMDRLLWGDTQPGGYTDYSLHNLSEKVPPPPDTGEYRPPEQSGFRWATEQLLAGQQEQVTRAENGES
ncbi:MAG TPA: hypothetical protein VGO07_01195 [Candidatus Saccharimonadales bacterium]|jgi:hypothetical protein|nr:hypothetical protein [Candidatus Saccharimonadales bacterium]